MAHFAELDENNVVLRVTCVGNDEVAYNGDPAGEVYCKNLLCGTWKQTSYNTVRGKHYTQTFHADGTSTTEESADQSKAFRGNYAGSNFTYDAEKDVFIPPKYFDSWTLHSTQYIWEPPVAYPSVVTDANDKLISYYWVEDSQQWKGNPMGDDGRSDESIVYTWNPGTSSWS